MILKEVKTQPAAMFALEESINISFFQQIPNG